MMDINELFLACRRGDLSRVQHLVEQKEVDLNVRDKWDSTPLYYACLCGHEELVKYLLENDAKCEANTFDGERCLYGALTNRIRNLLKNYKAVTSSTMRRDLYTEFLRKLLEGHDCYEDIEFIVHGERFTAHRCILAARSEYFADLFKNIGKDKVSITVNRNKVLPSTFRLLLQHLYTARVEVAVDQVDDLLDLARCCRLQRLESSLSERMKHVASFECTKPGVSVTVVSLEPVMNECALQQDLGSLADHALPAGYANQTGTELPFLPEHIDMFADVIFSVEDHQFRCHKVFFTGRSEYFKVLLKHSFDQCQVSVAEDGLNIVSLQDISVTTFVQIMYYIYQDSCELTDQNVYDVLYKADLYLLPGLKRQCAAVIARHLDTDNVVSILRLARLLILAKLEDQCTEFISRHLYTMLGSAEFSAVVQEDARTVQRREATDSIPVIDDVRFHISSGVQTFGDMYEAEQRLAAIDAFLDQLELDG